MTDRIPVKGVIVSGAATALAEFEPGDQIAAQYIGGLMGSNMLINCGVPINQFGFAGGALAANTYGYDRWKAGSGGCNITINATTGVYTHTGGPLVQVVEAPEKAWGQPLTISVEDPSGSIAVSVGGATGTITAGSGRRGLTLTPIGSGNMTVQLTATGVTYSQPKLERGTTATAQESRLPAVEMALCQWYRRAIRNSPGNPFANASVRTAAQVIAPLGFGQMRATPAASHIGVLTAVISNVATAASAVTATASSSSFMYLTLTVAGLTPGQAGYVYATPPGDSVILLDAEIY